MKILSIDIETAPNTAHVWGLFKQTIAVNQILDTGRVMCFAARWLHKADGPILFRSEKRHGHEATIRAAHRLLDEADAVLSFNGEKFDLPTLNREFLKYGLAPPAPYRHIDLLKIAKRRFRFASNKLDHLARELDLPRKVSHRGHDLWIACMNGEKDAWREMEEYNKQDVVVLEELYYRLLPWIDTHPNCALYREPGDELICTNCGSDDVHQRGVQHNKTHSYTRYQCNDCGTWMRERFSKSNGRKDVLTQVGG